jgi:hypothetical protein
MILRLCRTPGNRPDRSQPRAVLGLMGGSAFGVRPRLLRWGATDEEARRPYPGAELIPGGKRSATMAVTIDASAERVHAEWQQIGVGDRLAAKPDGSEWWEVAALEPERFPCLRMSLDLRGRPFDPVLRSIFLEPSHWIIQTRQFANLKRHAELPPPTGSDHG